MASDSNVSDRVCWLRRQLIPAGLRPCRVWGDYTLGLFLVYSRYSRIAGDISASRSVPGMLRGWIILQNPT